MKNTTKKSSKTVYLLLSIHRIEIDVDRYWPRDLMAARRQKAALRHRECELFQVVQLITDYRHCVCNPLNVNSSVGIAYEFIPATSTVITSLPLHSSATFVTIDNHFQPGNSDICSKYDKKFRK